MKRNSSKGAGKRGAYGTKQDWCGIDPNSAAFRGGKEHSGRGKVRARATKRAK